MCIRDRYYTITMSNTGDAVLTNVEINDPMITPSNQMCASVDTIGGAGSYQCILTGYYVVQSSDLGSDLQNVATVTLDQNPPGTMTDTSEVIIGSPAINLVKSTPTLGDSDGDGVITLGDTLYYSITATNTGSSNLSDVVVSDALLTPSSTTSVSYTHLTLPTIA